MSEETKRLQRTIERVMNSLIGRLAVQETIAQVLLKRLLHGQERPVEALASIKAEVVGMLSHSLATSGDPKYTRRLREVHAMLAEEFFHPIEDHFRE